MPKLKDSQFRKRVNHACDGCRRRKEKCESRRPCASCIQRGIECHFTTAPTAGSTSPRASTPAPSRLNNAAAPPDTSAARPPPRKKRKKTQVQLSEQLDPNDAEDAIDHVLNQPGTHQNANDPAVHLTASPSATLEPEAPVPRVARLLRDGRGKFIYIGDSASLSFLQNVRRVVSSTLGDCDFTTDRLRHSFFEHVPDKSFDTSTASEESTTDESTEAIPTFEEAETLVNQYLIATACLLDLFDIPRLLSEIREWVSDPSSMSGLSSSILSSSIYYLVLAIGAQVSPGGQAAKAEFYFTHGRRLAFSQFTEQPSIQTAQSYALIAMYLLGACRRNAAFMNLGIAVRAAYALGLHRGDIHALFSEAERKSRDRVWQSLRVLDLFMSASLGRPPSTSDFEKDPSIGDTYAKPNLSSADEKFASAVLRLCSIFERILIDVYKKQGVSKQLADDISRQYRWWASKLPRLPTPLHNEPNCSQQSLMFRQLASAHLIGAYHWSIILLTRPFLMFSIQLNLTKLNREPGADLHDKEENITSMSTFADACIDSAIRGLDIADDLIQQPQLPQRLPFVLNSVFNSALAIGVAFFGDHDRHFPLSEGMDKAKRILDHMRLQDPQAKRFAQLIGYLHEAAKKYIRIRDRSHMQQRSKTKNELFGAIGTFTRQAFNSAEAQTSELQNEGDANFAHENTTSNGYDENSAAATNQITPGLGSFANNPLTPSDQPVPTLTTSGLLIGQPGSRFLSDQMQDQHQWLNANDYGDSFDPFGVNITSYAETIPMFNLLDEI